MTQIIQIIFKKLFYFAILPSPLFFSLYFDIFQLDIDWFHKKKIQRLELENIELKRINQLHLEENKKIIEIQKQTWMANLDTQKILIFVGGLALTCFIGYLGWSFFNNNNGAGSSLLVEHANENTKSLMDLMETQNKSINHSIEKQCANMINYSKTMTVQSIDSIGKMVSNQTALSNEVVKNSVIELGSLNTNLNEQTQNNIAGQASNLIEFMKENILNKLNKIDRNFIKMQQTVHTLTGTPDNDTTVSTVHTWGEGRSLGTGEAVASLPDAISSVSEPASSPKFSLDPKKYSFK